ncbi:MAG: aminomethyltransferase family protein [Actinomycetota bacterium]
MDPIDLNALPDDVHTGPFHDVQVAAGAGFYEDLGRLWTKSFGDPQSEYWAVRRGTGLWDISALIKFHLTGSDVLPALDRLTTRAMLGAQPGTVRYGMVLNEKGLMLDEGTSLVLSAREAYFFGNDGSDTFLAHLADHTADLDVQIGNVTDSIGSIAVQGPGSLELLAGLTDADIGGLRWFHLLPERIEIAGAHGLLVRAGFTGELGYEFYLVDGHAGAKSLWGSVVEAGARPIGLDAIEMLRVEAGLVIAEEDYLPGETNPYDLSLERYIDLEGHEFIGRDACVVTAAAPPRRFVTLTLDSDGGAPRPGSVVRGDHAQVGVVTSAFVTPRFGALALAVVDAASAGDGTTLQVDGQPATVRPLPIDDPGKERPRLDFRRRENRP